MLNTHISSICTRSYINMWNRVLVEYLSVPQASIALNVTKQEVLLPCSQHPAVVRILSQMNPFHRLPSYICKINFTIIHLCPGLQIFLLRFRDPPPKTIHATYYVSMVTLEFNHPTNICEEVRNMKRLVMQFYQVCCQFHSLINIFFSTIFSNTSSLCFSLM